MVTRKIKKIKNIVISGKKKCVWNKRYVVKLSKQYGSYDVTQGKKTQNIVNANIEGCIHSKVREGELGM